MSASSPVTKVQEVLAHMTAVHCAHIGRHSGQVMVTGGADKRVCMWTFGKPDAILSLSSHASAVTSVRFDNTEERVLAGTEGGALKLWDLASQKAATFTGHRSAIECCDTHPTMSALFASGSRDTQVKLWDARRRGSAPSAEGARAQPASANSASLCTFKGHSSPVTCIRFSPDGRWVISGCEDGNIIIWDLAAGKSLAEFPHAHYAGAVTAIDFHPTEVLMATGGVDRRVVFWDLETMTSLGCGDTNTSRIRALEFSPDGRVCIAAAQDSMRLWSWEPVVECLDYCEARWGNVVDLHVPKQFPQQCLAVGLAQSFVTVWATNLSRMAPYGARPSTSAGYASAPAVPAASSAAAPSIVSSLSSASSAAAAPGLSSGSLPLAVGAPPAATGAADSSEERRRGPASVAAPNSSSSVSSSSSIQADPTTEILSEHDVLVGILVSRLTHIRGVVTLWDRGDTKAAFSTLAMGRQGDANNPRAAIVDVVRHLQDANMSLDVFVNIIPSLKIALESDVLLHVETVLQFSQKMWSRLKSTILSTLDAPAAPGVDLSREARLEKCKLAREYHHFVVSFCRTVVQDKGRGGGGSMPSSSSSSSSSSAAAGVDRGLGSAGALLEAASAYLAL